MTLTKEQAQNIVDAHFINLDDGEETEILEDNNPELVAAYRALLKISEGGAHDTPDCVRIAIASERERIASAWDGCVHDAPGGDVDIGASIRARNLVSVRAAP